VIGPDGRTVGAPLIDEEGIVYADIDLSRCIQPRQMHDITGHYNRFDVFDLRVDRTPKGVEPPFVGPIDLTGDGPAGNDDTTIDHKGDDRG
jgi:aliphatic nitrilase